MVLWLNVQLVEAAAGRFNPHLNVEYEWNLRLEEIDESDDDLDDKVCMFNKSCGLANILTLLS